MSYCASPERRNNLATRLIGGETIVVPVRSGVGELSTIYSLNELGTAIWELIDGKTSVSSIVDRICTEFEVSCEVAASDVQEYLECLEEAGLIQGSSE